MASMTRPESLGLLTFLYLAASLYLYVVYRRKVAPGAPRIIAGLPFIALNLCAPRMFRRGADSTTITLLSFITLLANFKILLWAINRSMLASSKRLTFPQFTALLLTPLTPVVEAGSRRRGRLAEEISTPLRIFLAKWVLLGVMTRMLRHYWLYPPLIRAFFYGLALYSLLSSIMDGPGAVISRLLGIRVSPHFDTPWMTTSVASFWNHRWDLAAGNALRQLFYEPIIEGRLLGPGQLKGEKNGAQARPSTWRMAIGSTASFAASGFMHELIFWYLTGRSSGGRWFSFFIVQVPYIFIEKLVLRKLRANNITVPQPVLTLIAVLFLCSTSAVFFWGPAEEAGVVRSIVNNVASAYTNNVAALLPSLRLILRLSPQ